MGAAVSSVTAGIGSSFAGIGSSFPGISLERARLRSGNAATTAARYHPSNSSRNLSRDYEIVEGSALGRGAHSDVLAAYDRHTRRKCALKSFDRRILSTEAHKLMVAEVEIHLSIDHPNVVRLYDVYEQWDPTKDSSKVRDICHPEYEHRGLIHMVMECCDGGELFDELERRQCFPEEEAVELVRQTLSALDYLNSHDIVHRDLKLDNILFADADRRSIKLSDFGFAVVRSNNELLKACCGTPGYVSPEVLLKKGYTDKCDMWSLGVVAWMLLTGRSPFFGADAKSIKEHILKREPLWESDACKAISIEGISFFTSCSDKGAKQTLRCTAGAWSCVACVRCKTKRSRYNGRVVKCVFMPSSVCPGSQIATSSSTAAGSEVVFGRRE